MRKVQQGFLKTNQTHQEYTGFLCLRMASFNQKLERRKASGGRDKSPSPQERRPHTPPLLAAFLKHYPHSVEESHHKTLTKEQSVALLSVTFYTDKYLFFACRNTKYESEMGVKVRNASGTTALGDCLCRGYFASYI